MRPVWGWVFLAVVLAATVPVTLLAIRAKSPSPIQRHAPCKQTVDGPTQQWACSDGRVYTLQDGHWTNSGPVTPAPWQPKA